MRLKNVFMLAMLAISFVTCSPSEEEEKKEQQSVAADMQEDGDSMLNEMQRQADSASQADSLSKLQTK
jgi:hypothetical protein